MIGKLVASLLFALLLLLASVPVFSVVFLFGGVELAQVIGVAAILGLTVVVGAIGLMCSTLMRRPTGATVVAYIIAFLYLIVPLGTSIIYPTSISSRTVQAYAMFANPAFALGSTLLDTPIRSPINAPSQPQSAFHTPLNVGGTSCTVTSTGSFCTSIGSGGAGIVQPTPVPIPPNDKVQAGIFKGFRAWQAFGTSSLLLVAIVVSLSVAILSERPVHLPGRRRRRKARTTAGSSGALRGASGSRPHPEEAAPVAEEPVPPATETVLTDLAPHE